MTEVFAAGRDVKARPDLAHYLPALPPALGGDGYDWMNELPRRWAPVPSWGRDGWDMGDWPYVIIATCVVLLPAQHRPPALRARCLGCMRPLQRGVGEAWRDPAGDPVCRGPAAPTPGHARAGEGWAHRPSRQSAVFGVATYVEGDLACSAYATHEDRTVALDELAAAYWRLHEHGPGSQAVPDVGPVLPRATRPFTWQRPATELTAAERAQALAYAEALDRMPHGLS